MIADTPPVESPGEAAHHYLEGVQSTLAAPLRFEEQVVGAIVVCSSEPGAFIEDHGLFLSLITEKLASTMVSWQRLERIQLEAQTDQVTGLPNARTAYMQLEVELDRAQREGGQVGVLFMDVNGLKPVNDSYGHGAGDRLLIETGQRLRSCLRSFDFLGRMGGDEFLAVLPGATREALEEQIDVIKTTLAETRIEVTPGVRLRPMVSVGAALYPDDASDADELVYTSDQRMYKEKMRSKRHISSDYRPPEVPARTA
jgi:diguanylate cyclase (GGDEF)-like protein